MASGLEVADIVGMNYWWSYWALNIIDKLGRVANGDSQNTNSENTANTSNVDHENANRTAQAVSRDRAELTAGFVPSKLTCEVASQQLRTVASAASRDRAQNLMAAQSVRGSVNAPGSWAERGSLQGFSSVWQSRCSTYFNSARITLPPGVTCPAPADPDMVDLDINPWRSILFNINLPAIPDTGASPPKAQAAQDTIRLLIEPVAQDPVKGAVLTRPEAQNIHVRRMRDMSRVGLARGALEGLVATRTMSTTPDLYDGKSISRMARYIEIISGQTVNGNNVSGALNSIVGSGQLKNANIESIAARLQGQKMIMVELLNYSEQLMALEAARLATKVDETRARGAPAAALPRQGN